MPKTYVLALDIGGTKINAGLVSKSGELTAQTKIPTQAKKNKTIILKNIFRVIDKLLAKAKNFKIKVSAISIGIAGRVDYKKGVFIGGPNFSKSFRNISFKIFKKRYHLPVFMDNDARLFTLGEAHFGAGKDYKDIIGITLGTGVGGGIIIDKKIYRGKNNVAGEFGHMIININGSKCSCGKQGHFEALASGSAISKFYKQLTGKTIDARQIEKKFNQGEKAAKITVARVSKNLALGLANLLNTLNPEIIILGGGLMRFKKIWRSASKMIKKQNAFPFPLKTKIVKAKLGDNANLLGAALLSCKSFK